MFTFQTAGTIGSRKDIPGMKSQREAYLGDLLLNLFKQFAYIASKRERIYKLSKGNTEKEYCRESEQLRAKEWN